MKIHGSVEKYKKEKKEEEERKKANDVSSGGFHLPSKEASILPVRLSGWPKLKRKRKQKQK